MEQPGARCRLHEHKQCNDEDQQARGDITDVPFAFEPARSNGARKEHQPTTERDQPGICTLPYCEVGNGGNKYVPFDEMRRCYGRATRQGSVLGGESCQ